jgi:hypothetical protein
MRVILCRTLGRDASLWCASSRTSSFPDGQITGELFESVALAQLGKGSLNALLADLRLLQSDRGFRCCCCQIAETYRFKMLDQ